MAADDRQTSEPVALSAAVRDLLGRLEVADLQVQLRLQMWRWGYAAAERVHAGDYERGFADGVAASVKRIQYDLAGSLRAKPALRLVRRQRRSKDTDAPPHSGHPDQARWL